MLIGKGVDLKIVNDCNFNKSNVSCLGCNNSYEVPAGIIPNSKESNKYLAGD